MKKLILDFNFEEDLLGTEPISDVAKDRLASSNRNDYINTLNDLEIYRSFYMKDVDSNPGSV